ncbi:selenocysteine insertion sequence-binding protein 2-like [Takifugu flavidus]|uniref:selenocysteine insertion sequence-binding protein 2-like n=1 Tax=Takifugu flavidus TaxID=433684 RepID=UPI0025445DFB|nr:selenocysteine insertion sequence-binding protein 2-like [Takifugu flavidus]XP_056889540.1 selenocysteine insertion sequence-binding protein 2-like [Takifugu flavidus]
MNRTNTNWGSTGPKEMSRSHGWTSSSHGVRKTLQGNKEFSSQDRVMGKRSLDAQKKGFLGARSSPNSAGRSKPVKSDFLPFEVRMNDFPELAGNKSAPCHVENWRSSSPPKQSPAFSWTSDRREIPSQPECQQITTNSTSDSSTIAQSQAAVTSWANIASQPPRKPASHKSKTCTNLQSEYNPEQQEDVTSGKKKRRKKKKKTKSEGVEAESEGPASYQEPPKIEDEEEFPDLFLSLTVNDRMMPSSNAAKLCYEKIQKEGFHHLNDPSKENLNVPKGQVGAQNTQKTEKMSGKKSKAPVQLDIGNVLATLEKKQQTQKNRQDAKSVILSVGGGLPVVQKQPPVQKKLPWQKDKIAHNPLDSTSPLVKKGKQREVPKAKKPTPLKKVILKEREERKQRRLLEERGLLPEQECQPDDEAAEEEQHNTSGEVGSPAEELSDLSALNDANQVAKDCDEELETDQTVEQQIAASPSVSYPAGRLKIHSRKFRDYCTQMLSKDVDECVTTLLKELVRFQDRLYQKDPIKARMKRRIVMGLREVQKHLKLRKLKCVIISPNCERIQSKGGLDEALHTIIDTCREQAVPFVFALSRRALGRCVNKAVPVSLVGIFNYDGAQDFYHKMIELSSEARTAYEVMLSNLEQTDAEEAQQTSPLAEKVETSSGDPQPEEPEYLKIWNKIFEQDRSNQLLNFEKQLSFMHLESECIETTNGEES